MESVKVSTAVLLLGTMKPIFFAVERLAITGAGILKEVCTLWYRGLFWQDTVEAKFSLLCMAQVGFETDVLQGR